MIFIIKKGYSMDENMTNEQMYVFLKMILQIVKNAESKEDAVKKIEDLINGK